MRTRLSSRGLRSAAPLALVLTVLAAASFTQSARTQTHVTREPCRPLGATRGCAINGRPGHETCEDGVWSYCVPNPPPPPKPVTGNVNPKYYILTVIYAPPGTNGGRSSSSVTYGSGSTLGSSVSAGDSFKQGSTVSVTASQGILGGGQNQAGVSFGYTDSSTNTQSFDIKKAATVELSEPGPAADGVSHDHDQIWLLLNPTVQVSLFPTQSGSVSKVGWQLTGSDQSLITYVYVGWLKDPSQMIPGEATLLQRFGITSADFAEMLKADPFADSPNQTPDPNRYQPLFMTFPYEPPFSQGDPVPTTKLTTAYTSTQTNGSSAQHETTVGLNAQASGGFLGLFDLTVKDQSNWTWTTTDTRSDSTVTNESATVTVGGPAFGYQGPTVMSVYYDVLYKTFLFAPLSFNSRATLEGVVRTSSGQPVRGKEVVVSSGGATYRTYTSARGQYRIFYRLSGPVTIRVQGTTRELPQVPATRQADVVLPQR